MKKSIVIAILFVMLVCVATTFANATTSSELAEKLYNMGSKYGVTSADKVKMERYLADNPVTEDQANKIVAEAEAAVKVMENSGKTNYKDLTADEKATLKTKANNVASILGVTLTYKTGAVEVYKDGKLIETISSKDGKLAYTGNNTAIAIAVSSIAVVALAAGLVARKKANA